MMTAVPPPGPLLSSRLVEATPPIPVPAKSLQMPDPNAPVGPRPTFSETPLDRLRQFSLMPPVQKAAKADAAASYSAETQDTPNVPEKAVDLLR